MVSLEIAILLSIVLIIAVAVGWYIYTTFTAAAVGQPRLSIVSAEVDIYGQFNIIVLNPGPVDVVVAAVEIAGESLRYERSPPVVRVGEQESLGGRVALQLTPGTMVSGRVILSGGQSFPFNAVVKPNLFG